MLVLVTFRPVLRVWCGGLFTPSPSREITSGASQVGTSCDAERRVSGGLREPGLFLLQPSCLGGEGRLSDSRSLWLSPSWHQLLGEHHRARRCASCSLRTPGDERCEGTKRLAALPEAKQRVPSQESWAGEGPGCMLGPCSALPRCPEVGGGCRGRAAGCLPRGSPTPHPRPLMQSSWPNQFSGVPDGRSPRSPLSSGDKSEQEVLTGRVPGGRRGAGRALSPWSPPAARAQPGRAALPRTAGLSCWQRRLGDEAEGEAGRGSQGPGGAG